MIFLARAKFVVTQYHEDVHNSPRGAREEKYTLVVSVGVVCGLVKASFRYDEHRLTKTPRALYHHRIHGTQ